MTPAAPPHTVAAFLRIGSFLADTLFLAQAMALGGMLLWLFGKSELAGFAVIGGSVAGLLSVFAFNLFGAVSWVWNAPAFWRSLHPLNLSLALFAAAGYAVIVHDKTAAILISAAIGLTAGVAGIKILPYYPRTWIAICMGILAMRYAVPWRFSGIAAAAAGIIILFVWLRHNFPPRRRRPIPFP